MSIVRNFVISRGIYSQVYAPPKAVVLLRSAASEVHPCVQWTPLAELLFQSTDLAAVYVFDVSDLIGELASETSSPSLGPILKPLQRSFMKVNPQEATFIAASSTCALALKLLRDDPAFVGKCVDHVVCVSPPPSLPRGKGPGLQQAATALYTSETAAQAGPPVLDPLFAEQASHVQVQGTGKEAIMRGIAEVVAAARRGGEASADGTGAAEAVALHQFQDRASQQAFVAQHNIRYSELIFTLDAASKQPIQEVVDITARVLS
uniref:Uncharacterized protein n=1 Tax=Eutreptiella gymnastica TaxID=73025 RepID=A0A7S1NFK6_9EUGL